MPLHASHSLPQFPPIPPRIPRERHPEGPVSEPARSYLRPRDVDTGHGHIGRNESGAPANDVTVIFAPVSQAFRGELYAHEAGESSAPAL